MKKLLILSMAILMSVASVFADDKPIDENKLPKQAKEFIAKYYPQDKVVIATIDKGIFNDEYQVMLVSGTKLEFDNDGLWTSVETKKGAQVPGAIVDAKIAEYVKSRFPEAKITKIEKSKRTIDIELDNKIEMEFSSSGKLIEIDY